MNSKKHPIKIICEEAIRENAEMKNRGSKFNGQYLGDTREAKLIKNLDFQPFFVKHVVDLRDRPVSLETFTNFDDNVRTTAGYYILMYVPTTSKRYVKGKPFVIGQDLIRMRVTVSGPKHFRCLAERIPELGWMQRWCPQLKSDLFGIAKMHPGMSFYFSPDWIAYADHITKQAEAEGIDIDHKPFVVYQCTEKRKEEIEATHKMSAKKTKEDYKSVLDEVDAQFREEEKN